MCFRCAGCANCWHSRAYHRNEREWIIAMNPCVPAIRCFSFIFFTRLLEYVGTEIWNYSRRRSRILLSDEANHRFFSPIYKIVELLSRVVVDDRLIEKVCFHSMCNEKEVFRFDPHIALKTQGENRLQRICCWEGNRVKQFFYHLEMLGDVCCAILTFIHVELLFGCHYMAVLTISFFKTTFFRVDNHFNIFSSWFVKF